MNRRKGLTPKALKSALFHHQAGRLKQAETIYCKILQRNPRQPDALYHLGLIALQKGHYPKAIELIQQAIRIHPNNPDHFYHLGLAAMQLNNFATAFGAFAQVLELQPDYAAAYNDLGVLYERNKNEAAAIESYQNAVKYKPDFTDAYFNLARAQALCGNFETAIRNYEKVLELNPHDWDAYNNLGNLLKERGETARAVESYRQAIQIKPNSPGVYCNLGRALRDMGERKGAITAFRRALSLSPGNYEALFELALSEHHHEYNEDLQRMENLLLEPNTTDSQKMYLNFGLGKAFEDLKQYDTAFKHLENGNKIKRSSYDFSIETDRLFFHAMKRIFNKDLFLSKDGLGLNNDSQIFIVGMPRSGTTLVEQILASHPLVRGTGEIIYFKHVLADNEPVTEKYLIDLVNRLDQDMAKQLGNKYLKMIEPHQKGSDYVTNKTTLNFLYIGMIRLIFPLAKIIHCIRDPLDTCLSCYKHLFGEEGPRYAYDLQELASYYLLYQDLMAHWHATLPGYIFDNHYEALISDQENQTKKLLDFCGLSWDKQCLDFHLTKRYVKTASCDQVRRPIYNSSVAFWKNYEKHLSTLIQTFGQDLSP